MHKKCKDITCPICNRKDHLVDSKEEIQTFDVSNGEPQHITLQKQTTILLKGKHVAEQKFQLIAGSYVINEVLKNIFTTNGRGGYQKVGQQHFLIAERVK